MKVSEYRDIASALGRYATTREKASGPESVIGVQNKGGTLKFISGTTKAGLTYSTQDYTSSEDGAFIISARPFLQAAKVLPAKANVEIVVSKDRLTVKTEGGGRIDLEATGSIRDAFFAKKPKTFVADADVPGVEWGRMAKIFRTVAAKIEIPSVQHVNGVAYASCVAPGMRPRYASVGFASRSDIDEYNMAAYRDFWDALVALGNDGTMHWGNDGILARDGKVEVFSASYMISRYDTEAGVMMAPEPPPAIPIMRATGKADVSLTVPRKELIDIVKGQAPYDLHNRVTLEVSPDKLRITPFGEEFGQEVQAKAIGKGTRSLRADLLNGLLSSMDSKEVSLQWGTGMPVVSITSEGYQRWTILLAPVAI